MFSIGTFTAAAQSPATASSDASEPRHAKLLHAAQQFEAVMMGELMKPMSNSAAIGEEDSSSGEGGALKSFGVEAMAGAMAKSGALGFANRIVTSVEHHQTNISQNRSNFSKVLLGSADDHSGGN